MFGWDALSPPQLEELAASGPTERVVGALLRWAIDHGADRLVFEPFGEYGGVRPVMRIAGAEQAVDALPGRLWTMVLIWIRQQLSPTSSDDMIHVSHAGGETRFRLALTDTGHVAFDIVSTTTVAIHNK